MFPNDDLLWQKLSGFEFDPVPVELTFAARLARENAWTLSHAHRVVQEYRRFVYLAMRAGHPVTPSDAVDQAWHLHLTYTRSYWDGLCSTVLGKPLHHGPTQGGTQEDEKYRDWYAATLDSYRRLFEMEPPADIWPSTDERFAPGSRFARVETSAHWIVPKVTLRRFVAAVALSALCLFGIIACTKSGIGDVLFILVLGVTLTVVFLFNFSRTPGTRPKNRNDSSGCTSGTGSTGGCGSGCSNRSDSGCSNHSDSGSSGCSSSGCGGGGCGGGGD
jgi:hypothetical protein